MEVRWGTSVGRMLGAPCHLHQDDEYLKTTADTDMRRHVGSTHTECTTPLMSQKTKSMALTAGTELLWWWRSFVKVFQRRSLVLRLQMMHPASVPVSNAAEEFVAITFTGEPIARLLSLSMISNHHSYTITWNGNSVCYFPLGWTYFTWSLHQAISVASSVNFRGL